MTTLEAQRDHDVRTLPWRRVAVLVLVPAVPLVAYAAGVLLSYFVNDLDALPLDEVASGRHDPKDLWPSGTWWGPWVRLAGLLVGGGAPVALLVTAVGATVYALRGSLFSEPRRRSPAMVAALVGLAVVSAWAFTWFLGPTAAALATWSLD